MLINIPNGTEAEINGIPVRFTAKTALDFPCETVEHAAELCAVAKLKLDLSYTEEADGKQWRVRFGAGGKAFREEIVPEPPEPKAKPKAKAKK